MKSDDLTFCSSPIATFGVCLQGKCLCFFGTSRGSYGCVSVVAQADGREEHSVDWKSEDTENEEAISSLFCDTEGKVLFSARTNGTLSQAGANDWSQAKLYSIQEGMGFVSVSVLQDGKYAYLSSERKVVLHSFAKDKVMSTLVPSHDSIVSEIAPCLGEKFLLGAGGGLIDFWKVNRRPAAKPVPPVCTVKLPPGEAGQVVTCFTHDTKPLLACVFKLAVSGKTLVYFYNLSIKAVKSKCKDESVLLATVDCGKQGILGGTFVGDGETCVFALDGSENTAIRFHDVTLSDEGGQTIDISADLGAALEDSLTVREEQKKRKKPEEQGVGEGEERTNGRSLDEDGGVAKPGPLDDTPLDVRVLEMALKDKKDARVAVHQTQSSVANRSGNGDPLNADSAVVLLSQALQSSDKQLLEQCFQLRQEPVISNTVKLLRSDQVGKLLPLLVDRINSSCTRAMQVACWIRHVVRHHLTYIISAPSMKGHLSSLYQQLEERQSSHNALLGLHGRLELLTTHIRTMKQTQSKTIKNGVMNGSDNQGYYSASSVVHVHEADQVETILVVPELGAGASAMDEQHSDVDEDMEDGGGSSEGEDL